MNKLISLVFAGCLCLCQPTLAPAKDNCPPERNLDTVAQIIGGNKDVTAKVVEGLQYEAFREVSIEMFPGTEGFYEGIDGILILFFRGMKTVNIGFLDGFCITYVEQGLSLDLINDILRETDRKVAEKGA